LPLPPFKVGSFCNTLHTFWKHRFASTRGSDRAAATQTACCTAAATTTPSVTAGPTFPAPPSPPLFPSALPTLQHNLLQATTPACVFWQTASQSCCRSGFWLHYMCHSTMITVCQTACALLGCPPQHPISPGTLQCDIAAPNPPSGSTDLHPLVTGGPFRAAVAQAASGAAAGTITLLLLSSPCLLNPCPLGHPSAQHAWLFAAAAPWLTGGMLQYGCGCDRFTLPGRLSLWSCCWSCRVGVAVVSTGRPSVLCLKQHVVRAPGNPNRAAGCQAMFRTAAGRDHHMALQVRVMIMLGVCARRGRPRHPYRV
jgi:hypothetical protein